MATTYNSLVANTPIWLYAQNRDINTNMPKIISDAEDQLYLRFDHDLFQSVISGLTIASGVTDIDLTTELAEDVVVLEVRALRLKYRKNDQWTPLEPRNLEAMSMLYSTNRPGRPRYYAMFGSMDKFRVFPTPNAAYDLEITANVAPPRLGAGQQENIITQKFPRVIERAVLRQGAIFMRNQQDAQMYGQEMEAALMEANAAIARHRRDDTDIRMRDTANAAGS